MYPNKQYEPASFLDTMAEKNDALDVEINNLVIIQTIK